MDSLWVHAQLSGKGRVAQAPSLRALQGAARVCLCPAWVLGFAHALERSRSPHTRNPGFGVHLPIINPGAGFHGRIGGNMAVAARHLTPANYRVMPWKNGQGTTTEIAAFPPGAGLETFVWRISMADIGA